MTLQQSSNHVLTEEIQKLKEQRNAVLLVHNYQTTDIYDVADFIGDSLELSRKAQNVESDVIVFCGVDFMAETAYILNPEKTILIPTTLARCPMAAQITAKNLIAFQKQHPDAATVCYVNTSAEVKAASDICCTSANALKIVESMDEDTVLMVPDGNLAANIQAQTTKKIIPWDGGCYVHMKFNPDVIHKAKQLHPNAIVLAHPECSPEVVALADFMGSTSGIHRYAKESKEKEFIIATEEGMVNRLKRDIPGKRFYPALPTAICRQMKRIKLGLVRDALLKNQYIVTVPEEVRVKAYDAIKKMLDRSV
ncbi:MAG: quinolinate synthase NadA [Candidatus Ranarchaeia archaeon]